MGVDPEVLVTFRDSPSEPVMDWLFNVLTKFRRDFDVIPSFEGH